MLKSILITGANIGLGMDCARQLALQDGTEKIYLACRNEQKANAAKASLEETTGKQIFQVLLMDVSDLDSVRTAVASISEPIEALVMNAGGAGGKTPAELTTDGVTQIFAVNILGHVVLLDQLLKEKKLTKVALLSGSEAARGIPIIGLKRPKLQTNSEDEIASICDGSFFSAKFDPFAVYSYVKYIGALWISSAARKHPDIRILTVSPGNTGGTEIMNDAPALLKFMITRIGTRIMPLLGKMHGLETGAKRYVDGLNDPTHKTGTFYASKGGGLSGPVIDQGQNFKDFHNETYQDNANNAIHRFIN